MDRRHVSRMRKALWLALCLVALLPGDEALACSSEDRIALAQMGYTSAQIDAQCGSGGNPFVTPSLPTATVCMTQAGFCYLGEQIPVGSRCWCPTGFGGVLYGVAR